MIKKNTEESRHVVKGLCTIGLVLAFMSGGPIPFLFFLAISVLAFIYCNTFRKNKDHFRLPPLPWHTKAKAKKQDAEKIKQLYLNYYDGLISANDLQFLKQQIESKQRS